MASPINFNGQKDKLVKECKDVWSLRNQINTILTSNIWPVDPNFHMHRN